MLLWVSWGLLLVVSLCLIVGKLQRGAHQNPLPGKRDFGWAPG